MAIEFALIMRFSRIDQYTRTPRCIHTDAMVDGIQAFT